MNQPADDPSQDTPARLLVFLSGSGRTLANFYGRIADGSLPAEVALVVANRPCKGLDIAADHNTPTQIIEGGPTPDQLDTLFRTHAIDWVVLAGYLKLVPITALTRGRIVNIHPALLPAFGGPGMHGMKVHAAAVEAAKRGEVSESGCTVHIADETYDTGPIVLQRSCPVHADDTPESLAARVFEQELEAYPQALKQLIASTQPSEPRS